MSNTTMTASTETIVKTAIERITEIKADSITLVKSVDNSQSYTIKIDNAKTMVDYSTLTEVEKDLYNKKVKSLSHSVMDSIHSALYSNDTLSAIRNSLYTIFYSIPDGETVKILHVSSASLILSKEQNTTYKTLCESLQKYYAEMLNTSSNASITPATALKVKKMVKKATQEVVDLFKTASPATSVNVYINDRDIEIIRSSIVKNRYRNFVTVGNDTVMGIIESMLYHKLNNNSYLISLQGVSKDNNGTTPIPAKTTKRKPTTKKPEPKVAIE